MTDSPVPQKMNRIFESSNPSSACKMPRVRWEKVLVEGFSASLLSVIPCEMFNLLLDYSPLVFPCLSTLSNVSRTQLKNEPRTRTKKIGKETSQTKRPVDCVQV